MFQQIELYKDKFLPPSHPAFERVVNVANQLIKSNKEIPQLQRTKWSVTVVNEPSITNAFVLPVSHLIVHALVQRCCCCMHIHTHIYPLRGCSSILEYQEHVWHSYKTEMKG